VSEFYAILDLPEFQDRRFILVRGEMIEMSIPKLPHDKGITFVQWELDRIFPRKDYWVRCQLGLALDMNTDPMPDFSVIEGPLDSHTDSIGKARLVVEVSDTTLAYDMSSKANLYAAGGVGDYRVLDTSHHLLHVFRDPVADGTAEFGYRYGSQLSLDVNAGIAPLCLPQATIRVADLFAPGQ